MQLPPKAESVDVAGNPDGFTPPFAYQTQVLEGGYTRLAISCPPDRLAIVHRALVQTLQPPLKLLYVRLTDRQKGQLPRPEHWVAVELPRERALDALSRFARLFYHDGRNQLWLNDRAGAQVVLEELGVLYAYPDDPGFHDVLAAVGAMQARHRSMAERDYVKVNFLAEADADERALMHDLALIRWERGL